MGPMFQRSSVRRLKLPYRSFLWIWVFYDLRRSRQRLRWRRGAIWMEERFSFAYTSPLVDGRHRKRSVEEFSCLPVLVPVSQRRGCESESAAGAF